MNIPNGFPIREVTQKNYYDDLDECLGIDEIEPEEKYTLRLIRNRRSQDGYALDYPVIVNNIETKRHEDGYKYPYLDYFVVIRPLSAEGVVLPDIKRARIMKGGLLYSTLRIAMTRSFASGHDGYFVGSDEIDDEWLDFQLPEPVDIGVGPESVTV